MPDVAHLISFDQDDSFGQAGYDGLVAAYLGGIVGGVGILTFTGAMIGYFAQPRRPVERTSTRLLPWLGPEGAGLSFSGSL